MGKDPLFVNKVAAAILSAGLLAMATGFIAQQIYTPTMLEKPAYVIAAADSAAAAKAGAAEAPAGPKPVMPMLASADVENGKKVAKKCASCHTFTKGGAHKIGPNLWDVVDRQAAGADGYAFSSVLQGLGKPWSYEHLNQFLYKPTDFAKGTKMTYAGLKKDQDRADLIAYLRTLSDNPKPMP